MATYFNIDCAPVSGNQGTYGLTANGNSLLMCDAWVCRMGSWWILWNQDRVISDPCQQTFGIGGMYQYFAPSLDGYFKDQDRV